MAVLTGGQVVSEEVGLKLENVTLDLLGTAKRVVITKDNTTIVDGGGSEDDIAGRINQIKAEIENTDSDWDREKLQERLAKLAGGVALIKVGAATASRTPSRRFARRSRKAWSPVAAPPSSGHGPPCRPSSTRWKATRRPAPRPCGRRSPRRLATSPTTPASKAPSSCARSRLLKARWA
jgi:hypothetical protein